MVNEARNLVLLKSGWIKDLNKNTIKFKLQY